MTAAGYVDYYNQNRNAYNPPYHHQHNNQHHHHHHQSSYYDRYPTTVSSTYYPPSNRYYDSNYDRRWSSSSNNPPPNYNPHYWDYHNRYGGGGGNHKGYYNHHHHQTASSSGNSYYSEYPSGQGGTTVNGERCLASCRQNRDAGFYYCQIDDQGAWDFCCRPDHFCGYSKGLSVPWCYVGTGPSQNIWRSCEAKGTRNNAFFSQPHVAYLHDRLPPTVHSLTSTQVANLTKDNAIRLFTNNSVVEEVGNPQDESNNHNRFVAKPVMESSSQEVIVRLSNATTPSINTSTTGLKKDESKKKS